MIVNYFLYVSLVDLVSMFPSFKNKIHCIRHNPVHATLLKAFSNIVAKCFVVLSWEFEPLYPHEFDCPAIHVVFPTHADAVNAVVDNVRKTDMEVLKKRIMS